MTAKLDHMIVTARDKHASATFLADILGVRPPVPAGHFMMVEVAHGLTLDFDDFEGDILPQHYAFAVSEPEFDDILGRIRERRLRYWADPQRTRPDEVAQRGPGRAVYFEDPSGHWIEVLTR